VWWSPTCAGSELVATAAPDIQRAPLRSTWQRSCSQPQADMAMMAKGRRKVRDDSADFQSVSCP